MVTLKGTLVHGLKLGDHQLQDFVIRAATTADMVRAEIACPMDRKFGYRLALAGQQLVSLGTLQGPIDFERMQELDTSDIDGLLAKQSEVEELSKNSRSGTEASSSPSLPSAAEPTGAETK